MHRRAPASVLIGSLLLAGLFAAPHAEAAPLVTPYSIGGYVAAATSFFSQLFDPLARATPAAVAAAPSNPQQGSVATAGVHIAVAATSASASSKPTTSGKSVGITSLV